MRPRLRRAPIVVAGIALGPGGMAAQGAPPPAPQNVSVTALSSHTVRITWSAVTASAGVKEYRVYRLLLGITNHTFSVTTTSAIDTGLLPLTTYQYFVTAIDFQNREGAQSTAVSITMPPHDPTPPSSPTGLSGTATGPVPPGVDLSWAAASDAQTGIRHYRVYRNGSAIDTSGSTSYHDASVQGSTAYQYEVSAVNWEGLEGSRSQAAAVTTRDDTPPTAPTGLSAQAASHARVDLSWSAASDPESGIASYDVFRDGTKVGSSGGTSFADTGLQETTTYSYEVAAVNGEGLVGPKSGPATVTTPAAPDQTPPTAPTGLSGSAAGPDRVDLSWSAASDPESGIGGYRVYRDGSRVGSPGGTSFSDTGLQPSTTYQYRVTAVNGEGLEGPPSAAVSVATDAAPDDTPPTVPTDLEATAASPTRVDLSWTAASDPESGIATYRVYRGGSLLATSTSTTYADTTAVAGTTYSYEVSAVNGAGLEGGRSAAAGVTTPRPPDTVPPAPPTRLRIVP